MRKNIKNKFLFFNELSVGERFKFADTVFNEGIGCSCVQQLLFINKDHNIVKYIGIEGVSDCIFQCTKFTVEENLHKIEKWVIIKF